MVSANWHTWEQMDLGYSTRAVCVLDCWAFPPSPVLLLKLLFTVCYRFSLSLSVLNCGSCPSLGGGSTVHQAALLDWLWIAPSLTLVLNLASLTSESLHQALSFLFIGVTSTQAVCPLSLFKLFTFWFLLKNCNNSAP